MSEKAISNTDKNSRHIAVIGAGSIGINCALSLQRDGHRVVMIDPLEPGEGCSSGNAGLLARSSFIPLSSPGLLFDVPGWLLDPMGPLAIRWSYLPKLAPWLIRYILAGKKANLQPTADALQHLTDACVDLYAGLAEEAGEPELIKRSSYIYVYESKKSFDKDAGGFDLRRKMNIEVQELGQAEIQAAEPALSPAYQHAYLVPDHGFTLDPLALMRTLAKLFERRGGEVRQTSVQDIVMRSDGCTTLILEDDDLEVDQVVLAAGAYSGKLAAKLGSPVPLDTERGYHITIPRPGAMPSMPVMSGDAKFLATPMSVGLRLAGTVEFAGLDAAPNYKRARNLIKHGQRMFPGLQTDEFSEWMGRRPTLPDSLPVVGRSPKHDNIFFAFGHQHIGLTAGPETGRIIADLVADRRSNIDLTPYRADRF
ncbi:MAG: FAD-binding oxidoreductase [Alphaproteobacteria bacterium]|jgi:D-amino-acid dehydrogenase|nr:FAD-binding oxidoreductase [Alphaproteobacteria bacterium]MBT4085938.1 FAD-binding oxidoreductase [Alphaproteobacteria bacterium]MBT4542589.1 FAD-binding oxidoreductase [Alphaproteobacteria bacterium]MBT7746793.1 FAD-binding oxidoreductase [Alphaproteobacteria bacterium]